MKRSTITTTILSNGVIISIDIDISRIVLIIDDHLSIYWFTRINII